MDTYLIAILIIAAYLSLVRVILKIKVTANRGFYDDEEGDFIKRHTDTEWADDL